MREPRRRSIQAPVAKIATPERCQSSPVVSMPLAALAEARARPAFEARVAELVLAYQSGKPPDPIPVGIDANGVLHLMREGNHRLAAARLAHLTDVEVTCEPASLSKLRRIALLFA